LHQRQDVGHPDEAVIGVDVGGGRRIARSMSTARRAAIVSRTVATGVFAVIGRPSRAKDDAAT
jgi:hypothetical protein